MLWDRGDWEPVGDPQESYRQGKFKFRLHGEKLRGGWMLVRTARGEGEKKSWLLFKERDDEAKPAAESDVLDDLPLSVASGRSLEEIAAQRDRVWNSGHHRMSPLADVSKSTTTRGRMVMKNKPDDPKHDYDARKQLFAGVRLTSPDKVLYPEAAITKIELARYYQMAAEWMLPHVAHRPLVLVRCPEGREGACFYQKHPAAGSPDTLRQIPIRESDGEERYFVADDADGLISLAQIGALEIHAWGSREDRLEQPDRLIFDLDPDPAVEWSRVVQSARQIHEFLQELGLESFVKTTGGKGLHLVVPIVRRHDWDEARAFCKQVADLIATADPNRYTANMSKAARRGKIYIDYLRNGRGSTAIIAYSTRARPGAPVSTPLTWEELSPRITSDRYTVRNLARRLTALKRDPWEGIAEVRQGLARARKKLQSLSAG